MVREVPALHACDMSHEGFEWIDARDSANSVIAFLRRAPGTDEVAVVVCNFTPVVRHDYRVGVPAHGAWRPRLNTDSASFGGSGIENPPEIHSEAVEWHGRAASVTLTLPPLATLVLTGPGG
jgi:1,4-alpha-glucan branching enzyme